MSPRPDPHRRSSGSDCAARSRGLEIRAQHLDRRGGDRRSSTTRLELERRKGSFDLASKWQADRDHAGVRSRLQLATGLSLGERTRSLLELSRRNRRGTSRDQAKLRFERRTAVGKLVVSGSRRWTRTSAADRSLELEFRSRPLGAWQIRAGAERSTAATPASARTRVHLSPRLEDKERGLRFDVSWRLLDHSPAGAARLSTVSELGWTPDDGRFREIKLKLALGGDADHPLAPEWLASEAELSVRVHLGS